MKINKKWLLLAFVLTLSAVFFVSTGDVGAYTGIDGGYVGSAVCGTCHTTQKADFDKSGHSYKYRHTGGAAPADPISVLFTSTPGNTIASVAALNYDASVCVDADLNGKCDVGSPAIDADSDGKLDWAAVNYMVGGFGWKARWGILDASGNDKTGLVWSAASLVGGFGAQYNQLAVGGYDPLTKRGDWSTYGSTSGQGKKYNCAVCHNTNGSNGTTPSSTNDCYTALGSGRTQPWGNNPSLSPASNGGYWSEWTFDSVQCEACHGAGETHSNAPSASNITSNTSLTACGQCHTRHANDEECFGLEVTGGALTGGTSDGFIKHHEQYNEMVGYEETGAGKGVHAELSCVACHDPHKRSHKVPDDVATALGITDNNLSAKARGAVVDCASCHEAQKNATGTVSSSAAITAHNAAGVDCIDCHMAEATKSGTGIKGTWGKKGDDKTHIFKINPSATAATVGTRTNSKGKTIAENYLSTDYACGKCHDSGAFEGFGSFAAGATLAGPTDKATAETSATNYHNVTGIDGGYVGSNACAGCHTSNYNDWAQSGHPYKYRHSGGATPTAGTDPISMLLTSSGNNTIADVTAFNYASSVCVDVSPADGKCDVGSPAIDADANGKLDWSAVNYVVGGFGWKARWGILDTSGNDLTGFVWSSGSTAGSKGAQYNMLAGLSYDPYSKREDWSKYGSATGQSKAYNCAVCHNTNGTNAKAGDECTTAFGSGRTEPWASNAGKVSTSAPGGYLSEWTFDSVQCEACHGPSKDHVANPVNAAKYPNKNLSLNDCGKCHTRHKNDEECFGDDLNGALTNGAADGFGKHHEQFNEMVGVVSTDGTVNGVVTPINMPGVHASLKCQDCHNPHKRSHKVPNETATALGITDNNLSAEARGAVVSCESCHPGKTLKYYMYDIKCIDCHMAEVTKSATGEKGTWGKKGDDKSHIFKIDPTATINTVNDVYKNSKGKTISTNYITVDYACGKCHDSTMSTAAGLTSLTKAEAQLRATKIHITTNTAPTANYTKLITGLTVTLTDTSTDSGVAFPAMTSSYTPVFVKWGDGSSDKINAGTPISHLYATAGKFMIKYTVQDAGGLFGYKNEEVTVSPSETITVTLSSGLTGSNAKIVLKKKGPYGWVTKKVNLSNSGTIFSIKKLGDYRIKVYKQGYT
ncbi:MAG: hypothetical protein HZB30_10810, partial [Nitrospirae bacterium]|nr:hypothetical protein [Nitrospirota bacterium]